MLYVSYGMNSNVNQMTNRCPQAISLGHIVVPDHRLVFRGVADAVYSVGDTLQCVLWDITDECEAALDILEGYPYFYDKKKVKVQFMNVSEEAMMYYMLADYSIGNPSSSYLRLLEEGYSDHGLDLRQIYQAEGFNEYAY